MPLRLQAWASGGSKADRHPGEFQKPGAPGACLAASCSGPAVWALLRFLQWQVAVGSTPSSVGDRS